MSRPFNTKITTIYGGQSFEPQIRALKRGMDIVIGTPGRVLDMLKKGYLKIRDIKYLVIDEADEMLRFGFLEELELIFEFSNKTKRTLLFSATMPPAIVKLSTKYMNESHQISIQSTLQKTDNIKQYFMTISSRSKQDALVRIIDSEDGFYGLVFCNTKRQVDEIALSLVNKGYKADALHGDLTQSAREKVLSKFRKKYCTLLIVTDVVARGIDIEKLTHVINFSPPQDLSSYIHRIGRTGRVGQKGKAYTLVCKSESRLFRPIQRHFSKVLNAIEPPTVTEIIKNKKAVLMDALSQRIDKGIEASYLELATAILEKHAAPEALAAALEYTLKTSFSKSNYHEIRADHLDHNSSSQRPFNRNRFSGKRFSGNKGPSRFNSKKRYS
jgi:ATP-dependent RNA helicase DeaD